MCAQGRWAAAAGFGGHGPDDVEKSTVPAAAKKKPLSVSAAVSLVKSILADHTFRIEGEVSELSIKPGYKAAYFTIKDTGASLPCLMWMSRYHACGFELTLGMKVVVSGTFSIYAPKGRMNFDVSRIALAGEGDLRMKVAQLAQRLQAEGLTDSSRKRPIPSYPETIGLVTSPRGAAVHDVLRTLRRRYPQAQVKFAGVPVEGPTAPRDLVQALNAVASSGAEVVLLVRGGGSFEDLMPFNDEGLARAIVACPVPVVTGIGHEPDTSIADMVADRRASTPTGAAEEVSPQQGELTELLGTLLGRMTGSLTARLRGSEQWISQLESRPVFRDPSSLISVDAQTLDALHERLDRTMAGLVPSQSDRLKTMTARLGAAASMMLPLREQRLETLKGRLEAALPHGLASQRADVTRCAASLRSIGVSLGREEGHEVAAASQSLRTAGTALTRECSQRVKAYDAALLRCGRALLELYRQEASLATSRLSDLSPLSVLQRGWAVVFDTEGKVVKRAADVGTDDQIKVQLADGMLDCRVEGAESSVLIDLDA